MLSKKKARLSAYSNRWKPGTSSPAKSTPALRPCPGQMKELAEIFKDGQVEWFDGVSEPTLTGTSTCGLPTQSRWCLNLEAKSGLMEENATRS
jgi:hypothetical protein